MTRLRFLLMITVAAGLLTSAAVFFSCTRSEPKPGAPIEKTIISRGRTVYQSACIACHNPDPKKSGALGPEVWGSSLDLLEARIMRAEYPEGYTPKRPTHVMQAMPQVQKDIPALQAYLNSH